MGRDDRMYVATFVNSGADTSWVTRSQYCGCVRRGLQRLLRTFKEYMRSIAVIDFNLRRNLHSADRSRVYTSSEVPMSFVYRDLT
jgi:hypothetical protein